MADVVAGRIDLIFDSVSTSGPHVKGGRLKAIAIASAKRAAGAPDVPTIAESGVPGFDTLGWYGVVAPAGTSNEVVNRWNAEIGSALTAADMREKLASMGTVPALM